MINWNKSAKLNNCTVEWLKARFGRFPSSNKKIVTNCNNCNEERVLNFFDYRGDDSDLSKYTMSMTRSEHGKMHRRMQLAGYEVPHINSDTDDNGLWGYA